MQKFWTEWFTSELRVRYLGSEKGVILPLPLWISEIWVHFKKLINCLIPVNIGTPSQFPANFSVQYQLPVRDISLTTGGEVDMLGKIHQRFHSIYATYALA